MSDPYTNLLLNDTISILLDIKRLGQMYHIKKAILYRSNNLTYVYMYPSESTNRLELEKQISSFIRNNEDEVSYLNLRMDVVSYTDMNLIAQDNPHIRLI